MHKKQQNVVIVGGGFAGVKTALELVRLKADVQITFISANSNFEYHGALYRIVAGYNIAEVCFPLTEILTHERITIVEDAIVSIDTHGSSVTGASNTVYTYDSLVLALGMQTAFFGIKGMQEHAYGMKTIADALQLKHHIHSVLDAAKNGTEVSQRRATNIVVVGAGPTGVEVASELQQYVTKLSKERNIEPDLVNIYLIEAQKNILPTFAVKFSKKIEARLQTLGVFVHTSCPVQKVSANRVYLPNIELETNTIIWTAGVTAHALIKNSGFITGRCGRAVVTKKMQAKGHKNIYIAGDIAQTQYTGMAQTALYDAKFIAKMIATNNASEQKYLPKQPIYAVPAGKGWAGTQVGNFLFFGAAGWVLRRLLDFLVYQSFFPFFKAIRLMRHNYTVNLCQVCLHES